MRFRLLFIRRTLLAFALLLFQFSCTTPIRTLKEEPSRYAGEKASVSGSIVKIREIPLTTYILYTIQDDSFQAFVLANGNKSGRTLNEEETFSGTVQYAGTGDPVARSALQQSITRSLSSSSNPIIQFRARQIGAIVAPLIDEAVIAGEFPPIVVIVEDDD